MMRIQCYAIVLQYMYRHISYNMLVGQKKNRSLVYDGSASPTVAFLDLTNAGVWNPEECRNPGLSWSC